MRKKLKFLLSALLVLSSSVVGYLIGKPGDLKYFLAFLTPDNLIKRNDSLLNLTSFQFISNPRNLCSQHFQNVEHKNIITVIHSSRSNFQAREIIRRTYGSVKTYRGYNALVLFSLGISSTSPPSEEKMIEGLVQREWFKHDDLIIGNFEDSYKNLSYKHLMSIKWITEYCPEANYIVKSDDDVLVNIYHVIDFLTNKTNSDRMKNDFYCRSMDGEPIRDVKNKWYISLTEYSKKTFPKYCGFATYLVGIETARRILDVGNSVPFVWIDDLFVEGILRERVNEMTNDSTKAINFVQGLTMFKDAGGGLKTAEERRNCLALIMTRSPELMCTQWDLLRVAHNVLDIYVSNCNALL